MTFFFQPLKGRIAPANQFWGRINKIAIRTFIQRTDITDS